jgi:DNA-binding response OmpR family regulator
MRILVADDDPVYRSLLKDLLVRWHFDVVLVCDGKEAMDVLRPPDAPPLVILDWMMPILDGFEVCRRIRDEKDPRDLYIILLTGSYNREEITKVLVAGADDYLLKPFAAEDLKIHLRTAQRIIDLQNEIAGVRHRTRPTLGGAAVGSKI